ncbi:MAG: ribonuclease P protein component [Alphaproteobacteria bacterium]|nr:ribonuclease P protein component [Alphaproteobacteria bacterium]
MSAFLKIKKRKDFIRAAKNGQKVVTTSVILQAAQSLSLVPIAPKFGFTTTKKIGHAVVRNRSRRRMRAAVRELHSFAVDNTEYVLIGRKNTATCDFAILRRDLKYALDKVNKLLYNNKNETDNSNPTDLAD